MNEKGLKLLAEETAEQIRKQAAERVSKELHVHRKGIPRRQEIKELQQTEGYRKRLAEVLAGDALYQDCISLNGQPGSFLVAAYLENEEAYDAVADDCAKGIHKAARKYIIKKEKQLLRSYDIDALIAEVRRDVTVRFVKDMTRHLRGDRLSFEAGGRRDQRDRHYRRDRRGHDQGWYVDVKPENFDEFAAYFHELEENRLLSMAGYHDYYFGSVLVSAIEEKHSEIASLTKVNIIDVWDDEIYTASWGIYQDIHAYFNDRRLFEAVSSNRYLKKSFEGLRALRSELLDRVPDRMPDLFPAARRMERHFVIHVGPTNSGKTYCSTERLKEAERGIYLGPLRLLAFEQYQKLNEQGYPCSLYTGEEHQLVPGARLQASTIEMADDYAEYDVAVIDEAQMVVDRERGWAWTTAILGLRAKELHVCIAPYAEEIIKGLIEECGDSYEIVRHERQTPLVRDRERFRLEKECIHKHDALIVFSRRNVHAIASELRAMGISCSVIYGNLPYDVRQEEARRFRDGETDVVVATDAIGMGMNLPIRRLVFLEVSKFDGICSRVLRPEEVQQIAGRAGRRGMFDKGLWNSLDNTEIIAPAVNAEIPQIEEVYVGFPEALISIDEKLSRIITEWRNIEPPKGYRIAELGHEYELCRTLEEETDDKQLIYQLITIPFDEEDKDLRLFWHRACRLVLREGMVDTASLGVWPPEDGLGLTEAEQLYRQYDLAYAFTEKFGSKSESEIVLSYKKELSGMISEILKTTALPYRTCRQCGRKLRWNYPFGICSKCFARRG